MPARSHTRTRQDFSANHGRVFGLLLVALLAVSGAGGSAAPAIDPRPALVLDGLELLEPGDLVFRRGDSLASRAVLAVDPSIYSHVGIVVAGGSEVLVAHAAPGEDSATAERLRLEPIEHFLAPAAASAAAVYRPLAVGPEIGRAAAGVARGYVDRALFFDHRFSLASEDSLYCTELVWRAYLETGIDLLDAPPSNLETLFVRGPVILPSDLLASPKLREVHTFKPKEIQDAS